MPDETTTTTETATSTIIPGEQQQSNSTEFTPWKGFANDKGEFSPGWHEHLPEELGDARKSLGDRFKNVSELGKSYLESEKALRGKLGAVNVPTDKSTPEEVSAYRKALGVPETVDKYDFKPDNIPETIPWTPETVAPFAAIGHKHNIPPAAMKELAQMQVDRQAQIQQIVFQEHEAKMEAGKKALRDEWGDQFEPNINKVKAVAAMAGIDPTSHPAFSDPAVVKAFQRLSEKFSDDTFSKAGAPINSSSAEIANDVMTNKQNPMHEKYMKADPDTVAFVRHHLKQANPG